MQPAKSSAVALTGAMILGLGIIGPGSTSAPAAVVAEAGTSRSASPGSEGLGDRLVPGLGNGGYRVDHYHLKMVYQPKLKVVRGTVTIRARATKPLTRFNLDFDGRSVTSVRIDRKRAGFVREGAEVVMTPTRPIGRGDRFTARVRYVAEPAARTSCRIPDLPADSAWFVTRTGFFTSAQPGCAHTIFPVNDHPSDPATYSFAITVPAGLTAVTNGVATGKRRHGARTTWRYRQREPMASELIQIVVGKYRVLRGVGPHGLPLRSVIMDGKVRETQSAVRAIPEQIRWMERRVGRYPFATYGILGTPRFPSALETQTLSVFDVATLTGGPKRWSGVAMHELAHQWFGNSVMPRRWSDLWLNEGHATWYEYTYSEDLGELSLTRAMKKAYRQSNSWRSEFGPPARPARFSTIFSPNVYDGGALVLYALRQKVGDRTFRQIERAWVTRNRHQVARTSDYVNLSSRIAGRDLHRFLNRWLYGATVPPMPGHPRWRSGA